MYLAVDIGGTKTLVAVFSPEGKILETSKFSTPEDYRKFISDLENTVASFTTKDLLAVGVGVPGLISREEGIVHALGNKPWKDEPIRDDISKILGDLPVIIENDAKLAGLAEAVALHSLYQNVLYVGLGTGIGGALLRNGRIVKELEDAEMGKIPLAFEGKMTHWEEFASGRGIFERYNQRASDIHDPKIWKEIGEMVGYGLAVLCSVLQPDVIVFGGGAGQYIGNFKQDLVEYLERELHPVVKRPKDFLAAKHKEEGGIYGCYELVKQYYDQSA
jgi:glucokinase